MINVLSLIVGASVTTQIGVTEIVREDKQDVWPRPSLGRSQTWTKRGSSHGRTNEFPTSELWHANLNLLSTLCVTFSSLRLCRHTQLQNGTASDRKDRSRSRKKLAGTAIRSTVPSEKTNSCSCQLPLLLSFRSLALPFCS